MSAIPSGYIEFAKTNILQTKRQRYAVSTDVDEKVDLIIDRAARKNIVEKWNREHPTEAFPFSEDMKPVLEEAVKKFVRTEMGLPDKEESNDSDFEKIAADIDDVVVKGESPKSKPKKDDKLAIPKAENKTKTTTRKSTKKEEKAETPKFETEFEDGQSTLPCSTATAKKFGTIIDALFKGFVVTEADVPTKLTEPREVRNVKSGIIDVIPVIKSEEVDSIKQFKAIDMKIKIVKSVITLSIKFAVMNKDDDKEKWCSLSAISYVYKKEEHTKDFTEQETELYNAFNKYIDECSKSDDDKISMKTEEDVVNYSKMLDNDSVYDLVNMEIEGGCYDAIHKCYIGSYKIGYNYKMSNDYKYKTISYPSAFTNLMFDGKSVTMAILKTMAKNIYANRSSFVYHDKLAEVLKTNWDTAIENLSKINEDENTSLWLSMLRSKQCKNIVLNCYPANPLFNKFMNKLLMSDQSIMKLLDPECLGCISPLFSIFGVMSPSSIGKLAKTPSINLSKLINEVLVNSETINYAECYWAKAVIEDAEANNEQSLARFIREIVAKKAKK